ncbi:MAG: ABC transporter substrate-binding protein [Chloroflexi bacterium]|nr:ABC transporter substrate-binding protein [Chloroflexota bacterium]
MSQNRMSHRWLLIMVTLLLGVMLAACAPPASQPAAEKPVIKLAENSWSGSAVNVAVAKNILEKQMGYTVEVVTVDENAQWAALAKGDLHASLEVWPSGHAENVAEYIDKQKVVENGGLLGPVGKIAWFTPQYMIDQHPEFATWKGFKDPELAKLYATAETGDKGQFLAGDPSWVQYEDQIIPNLGLDLQVVVAGSEEAILAGLDAAYSRQDPILFYFWTPHSIFAKYDLAEVELPAYSEECYAKAASGGVDCGYPPDALFKIFWSGLNTYAPDAYTLLKNMNYSTQDQIEMIAAVELNDKTPDEAAQAWIDANEATWKAWLP